MSAERDSASVPGRRRRRWGFTASESDRVDAELERIQHAQSAPLVIAFGAVLGIGLLATLEWVRHPSPRVLLWAGAHLLIISPYLVREAWVRRRKDPDLATWSPWFHATIFVSGLAWGIEGVLFFDPSDTVGTALRLVFFAGLGVVCVATFAADFTFLRLAAVTALPQAAVMFLVGDPMHLVMGAGMLIYMSLCVVVTLRLHRMIRRSVELRFLSEDAYQSKARFLAAASHDLRQPLHALSLFVELLAARVEDPVQRAFVDRIDLSSRALGGLLNALLDLSRVDAGALKPRLTHFELDKLLRELEGEVAGAAARKGLKLEVKASGAIVESDRELLGRVVRNLLANAVRYTEKGTVIVEARPEGTKLVVSVADTGVGIPATAQEKVFEEFYQVGNPERDREQGLGLGLSIVRGICRTLEHRLTLISQPQRAVGTEVLVEVPLGDAARVVAPQPVRPSNDPGFRGRRVLVIDDEKDVRDAMKALLESWNCEPLCAGSFDEASAMLVGQAAPDAVVCDYRLPNNMNGAMAIEGLEKQLSRKLPALLVTGDTSPERIRELKQSGHAMLFKPALPGKLRAALSSLLNKSEP